MSSRALAIRTLHTIEMANLARSPAPLITPDAHTELLLGGGTVAAYAALNPRFPRALILLSLALSIVLEVHKAAAVTTISITNKGNTTDYPTTAVLGQAFTVTCRWLQSGQSRITVYLSQYSGYSDVWWKLWEESNTYGQGSDSRTMNTIMTKPTMGSEAHLTVGLWTQDGYGDTFSWKANLARVDSSPPELTLFQPEIEGLTVRVNGVTRPGTPGAAVTRIRWDWSDGQSEDRWFPASHTYKSAGTYAITTTSYQSDGLSTTKSVTVSVSSGQQSGDVWTNKNLYEVGETVIIYARVSEPLTIGGVKGSWEIKVNKPDGTFTSINLGSPAAGTYSYTSSAGYPVGRRRVELNAYHPTASIVNPIAVCYFDVRESTSQFDFKISVEPSSQTVRPGEAATFAVTVTLTSLGQTVALSLTGHHETMSCRFDPNSGGPTFASTLTIVTTSFTPIGNYVLTILGRTADVTKSNTIMLIVKKTESARLQLIPYTSKYEFVGENAFVWVQCFNYGEQEGDFTIRADVGTTTWRVAPTAVPIHLKPQEVTYVAFQVYFDKALSGTLSVSDGKETLKMSIDVRNWLAKAAVMAISILDFIPLGGYMELAKPEDRVRDFTKQLLRLYGFDLQSPEAEKARVLFDYVINHVEPGPIFMPKSINAMVDELNANGGVRSRLKIVGDCKQCSIFLAGLLRAADIRVTILCSFFEGGSQPLAGHVWLEAKIGEDWMFLDPTWGWYDDSFFEKEDFPPNAKAFARREGARKTYEFHYFFGGPLKVVAWDGVAATDRTSEYRLGAGAPQISKTTAVYACSPVTLKVYDERGTLLGTGVPFSIVFFSGTTSSMKPLTDARPEGQMVVLEGHRTNLKVEVIGLESGSYTLTAAYVDQSGSRSKSIPGTISINQIAEFEIGLEQGTAVIQKRERERDTANMTQLFTVVASTTSAVILTILATTAYRRRIRKQSARKSTPQILRLRMIMPSL